MISAALRRWHQRGLPATFALQMAGLALLAALAMVSFSIGTDHLPQMLALAVAILAWILYTTLAIGALQYAQSKRLEAAERFRLIFENTRETILFTWPDGRIENANPAACRLFRCSEEIICRLGRAGVMDVTDPRLQLALEERTRTGSFYGELRCRRPDGSTFPAEIISTQFVDASGTQRAINTIRDISERHATAEHLKALSQHVVAAQESARRRLSDELHAQTSPNLAAIGINLEIAALALQDRDWEELGTRMQDNAALFAEISTNIREIGTELRPAALDHAGLLPALQAYASLYRRRTGIAVSIACPHGNIRKQPELESMIFRILQEALTNSAKHAKASEIDVMLDLESSPLCLVISDNGVGFDPATLERNSGHGVTAMREMAEFASGSLGITSAHGKGVRIELKI